MSKITIISVGKPKEDYQKKAFEEYKKRLSKYCEVEFIEVQDQKIPDKCSKKDEEKILSIEGNLVLKRIPLDSYVFVLDVQGKELDSLEFADKIEKLFIASKSHLTFLIGGSLGVSSELIKRSDFRLSLSKMTFTHLMSKEILLEQIYRAMKIHHGEKYHK